MGGHNAEGRRGVEESALQLELARQSSDNLVAALTLIPAARTSAASHTVSMFTAAFEALYPRNL